VRGLTDVLLGSILLALAWSALQGEFTLENLLVGYLLGVAVVIALGTGGVLPSSFGGRVAHLFELMAFFTWELILANIRVALDVLRPTLRMRAAVVAVPLDARTDEEILLLSALINITPGSVTIDLSDERRTLYVHVMHMESVEQTRRVIKDGFERRVLQLFR
jgi:multicomponent Na+:H+ antiporter subunit E